MAPVLCRVLSYVSIREPSWPSLHKKPIIPAGHITAPRSIGSQIGAMRLFIGVRGRGLLGSSFSLTAPY